MIYNIWDKLDPKLTTPLTPKPLPVRAPDVADYTLAANIEVLTRPTELSASGQKAFKEDLEYYKILLEQYKSDRHEHEKEQLSL
jgi:hypothetical protein